jgi:integrase
MPVYRKGPDSWRVRIRWQGKRLRDWIVKGSKKDALAFEARQRSDLERGELKTSARNVPTWRDFTGAGSVYLAHARAHLKARTLSNRGYQIASLTEHLGDMKLSEIDKNTIESYQQARTKAGCRPATVNDDVKVLLAILAYARERGHPVPVLKPKRLKVRSRRHAEAWTRDEVDRLLATCAKDDRPLLPLVLFLLNTGCRRGEALALEWANVDLERRMVRIWASEEWQPKDGDNREVPIGDVLVPWLSGARASERWAFPSRGGERFAFWPQRRFDEIRTAAGLRGGPHKLRHTYATHFLASTPDLYLLAKVMGHSHSRVTELYGHLLPDQLKRAALAVSFAAPMSAAEFRAMDAWGQK